MGIDEVIAQMSSGDSSTFTNSDELIRRMMLDDLDDESAKYITPVNYGKLRGITPQLIYYYIRRQYIKVRTCDCGRKVIEREEADDYLRSVGKLVSNSEGPSESPTPDGDGGSSES